MAPGKWCWLRPCGHEMQIHFKNKCLLLSKAIINSSKMEGTYHCQLVTEPRGSLSLNN